jgi:hypothetical protein
MSSAGDVSVVATATAAAGNAGTATGTLTIIDPLAHCRSGGGHLRGCWAVGLVLGKG